MKASVLFITILGLFVACNNNSVINENSTKSNDSDTASIQAGNTTAKDTAQTDDTTKIEAGKCYLLQEYNEFGEPVESYGCIVFERNGGHTFEEAFMGIKTDLDMLAARMVNDEKSGGNYDSERWELRQVVRQVKNSPDDKLVYTSIELYMFSIVYNTYTIVYQFPVIDSEGNIYQITGLKD